MRFTTLSSTAVVAILSFSHVASAVTGQLGDAPVATGNPSTAFVAEFSNTSTIHGSVVISGNSNGEGVTVSVDLSNFPSEGGPFLYHIHVKPVDATGNCSSAGAHLDPYLRGEQPPCDPTMPQTCQVGDLSGKHGKIPANSTTFKTSYTDLYPSTIMGAAAYYGNRSIVVHYNSTKRIVCANFALTAISPVPTNTTTGGGNTTVTTLPTPSTTFVSAAASGKSVGGFLMGVTAAVFGALLL